MGFDGCCGQPTRRRRRPSAEPLPANPRPAGGVAMIFLGTGRRDLIGAESGLTYVVSEHRRHFRADPRDVADLTRRPDVMLRL
jgi:hypothetical protein